MESYETIVGMEIHVELKTKSKMFCGCKNDPFFATHPNMYTCPVCLGMPGGLPVPNRHAIESTILLGLAVGAEIPLLSKFDRKNYFYPDLAKGYQISQYDQPFCKGGCVTTEFGDVHLERIHLEEDTGKLQHTSINGKKVTLVDFNRSGVPLVEIVTKPDIRSGDQAKAFLKKLQQIIRYLQISDADMEQGSMRLEPNISVRVKGQKGLPPYKTEVKNINSFTFVKKAIEYEASRHIRTLTDGEMPLQETRGWNDAKGETFSQRLKENAADYRYFPEPDIPPFYWTVQFINDIKSRLPELPDAKQDRFCQDYVLNEYDSQQLCESIQIADFFEEAVGVAKKIGRSISPKHIANWMINKKTEISNMLPAELIERIVESSKTTSLSADQTQKILMEVLNENKHAVDDYLHGKEQSLMFLVGHVMRKVPGKGNAQELKQALINSIKGKTSEK